MLGYPCEEFKNGEAIAVNKCYKSEGSYVENVEKVT